MDVEYSGPGKFDYDPELFIYNWLSTSSYPTTCIVSQMAVGTSKPVVSDFKNVTHSSLIGSTANRSPLFYRGFDKDLFTLSGSQPS